jgi:DNA-binding beta-propeller fold protein YncE
MVECISGMAIKGLNICEYRHGRNHVIPYHDYNATNYASKNVRMNVSFYDSSVGKTPIGVAVNPFTKVSYVANEESNVSVIDYSFYPPNKFETRSVTNIPLGEYSILNAITINPNTNMVYVTTDDVGPVASQSTMYVINGSTNKVVSSVTVGPSPNYVAVNPNTNMIYVTNNDGTLSVINGSTDRVSVPNLTIGLDPAAIAVNPNTNMVYITHYTGTISEVNGTINKLVDGIEFSVVPSGSGTIQCGDRDISSINYIRYTAGKLIDCQATPNKAHDFIFSDWSGRIKIL